MSENVKAVLRDVAAMLVFAALSAFGVWLYSQPIFPPLALLLLPFGLAGLGVVAVILLYAYSWLRRISVLPAFVGGAGLVVSMLLGFGEFQDYRAEVRNRGAFDIEVDGEKEAFKVVKLGGYALAIGAWIGFLAELHVFSRRHIPGYMLRVVERLHDVEAWTQSPTIMTSNELTRVARERRLSELMDPDWRGRDTVEMLMKRENDE